MRSINDVPIHQQVHRTNPINTANSNLLVYCT